MRMAAGLEERHGEPAREHGVGGVGLDPVANRDAVQMGKDGRFPNPEIESHTGRFADDFVRAEAIA